MNTNANTETVTQSGTEIFVPLNRLKKSPRNFEIATQRLPTSCSEVQQSPRPHPNFRESD
jgi:hypothetical protein